MGLFFVNAVNPSEPERIHTRFYDLHKFLEVGVRGLLTCPQQVFLRLPLPCLFKLYQNISNEILRIYYQNANLCASIAREGCLEDFKAVGAVFSYNIKNQI